MRNMKTRIMLAGALMLGLICTGALARVKLVALPDRDAVTVRLDNPAATLVEEERVLTLQKGINQIDFSWQGVQIDENSIRIKVLSHPEQVTLLSVSYPPNEPALVWRIHSQEASEEKVRISYLLAGIDRLVTYKALADKAETQVDLKSYLVLRNFSGEDFDSARCLLDYGDAFTTGLRHEETKRMLFLDKKAVPIQKEFTWDAAQKPHDPEKVSGNVGIPVEYVIRNDEESLLGEHALWGGKARIYQDDGHESTIFLGEDLGEYAPVGEKMKLYIGDSRDIVVTQRRADTKRQNIRRDKNDNIEVYDELITATVKVENFKDQDATLTVVEHISGQWEPVEFTHDYERVNHSRLEFRLTIPAGEEVEIRMQYRLLNVFAQNQWTRYNNVRE